MWFIESIRWLLANRFVRHIRIALVHCGYRLNGNLHVRRRLRSLELGRTSHHLAEADTDTLDDGQQDGTADGTVTSSLVATTDGQRAAGEETGNDGVPGVLLLADALDGAVKRREETTPDTEVAAENGRSHLDRCDGADASLAVGGVAESLDTVPDGAADGL